MIGIELELEGEGRAVLRVTADDRVTEIPSSDASDPLGDLASAAVALLEGRREATFSTFDPPAEHLWRLCQTGRGAVVVDVERSDACVDLDPGAPSVSVVRTTCSLRDLAAAVSGALEAIARSHGIAGYEQIWRSHRFPSQQRARLRTALRRSR